MLFGEVDDAVHRMAGEDVGVQRDPAFVDLRVPA